VKTETSALLEKAERSIRATQTLLDAGAAEFAVGRAYYAMFYVAGALLHEEGLNFRSHAAIHAAFGKEFAKTGRLDSKYHRWLIDAFDERLQADYGFAVSVDTHKVVTLVDRARAFLATARTLLEEPPGNNG
jgi:uncharacterized protein (UPF0332 family)